MMDLKKIWKFINLKVKEELVWECTTLIKVLMLLLIAALNLHLPEDILSISQQKILFLNNMMVNLKIFSKIFMKKIINKILKEKNYGINTD